VNEVQIFFPVPTFSKERNSRKLKEKREEEEESECVEKANLMLKDCVEKMLRDYRNCRAYIFYV